MNLFRDDHRVDVGGHEIGITATMGLVHARWSLSVDGVEADAAAAAGDFSLHATLPDGTSVSAKVHQSLFGPTRVSVIHQGNEVGSMKGFVA